MVHKQTNVDRNENYWVVTLQRLRQINDMKEIDQHTCSMPNRDGIKTHNSESQSKEEAGLCDDVTNITALKFANALNKPAMA